MLNTYEKYCDTYINGKLFNTTTPFWQSIVLLEDDEVKSETKTYTWKDVTGYKVFQNNIYAYTKRNKKRFVVFENKYKMEKTPDLTVTFVTRYQKTQCSIKEILSYRDSERAIQYLVERGLNIFDELR